MTGISSADQFDPRLEALSRGWNANASGPRVAASLIAKLLCCPVTYENDVPENVFGFSLDLSSIRLRGMENVKCFLAGGSSSDVAERVRAIIRTNTGPSVALIWTTSSQMYDLLTSRTAGHRCVVMGREQIRSLHGVDSRDELTRQIRTVLPKESLIPYDILLSATGNMFYGRVDEMRRLRDASSTSFAIVGPGRAGKTSLVKSYMRLMKQELPQRSLATCFIDTMECSDKSADGYANFIASRIAARGSRVGCADLIRWARSQSALIGQSINLILDEADDICLERTVMTTIGMLARDGAVRLVLCGRGDLFRTMLDQSSVLANRLELLRLGPLDLASARKLLLEPMAALGLSFADAGLVDEVIRLTGRFPHLIQLYARHLVEYSIREHKDRFTRDMFEALRCDDELAQYFVSPLQDLRSPISRLVALMLLRDRGHDNWRASDVVSKVEGIGLQRARDLLNELVINHILTWNGDSFSLANHAVRTYADHLGLLDAEFQEALHNYKPGLKGKVES